MNSVSILIPISDSIQLTLTGSGRNPVRIVAVYAGKEYENGMYESADIEGIRVYYDDNTSELYDAAYSAQYIVMLEGPGELQYIRKTLDNSIYYWLFYYTYTENGVTTPETCIYMYLDD